jgi:transcriptional regulator
MKLTLEQINKLDKDRLTTEEIMYLKLRVFFSVDEIAKYNGLSRQWVSKIIKGAMEKVGEQLRETV